MECGNRRALESHYERTLIRRQRSCRLTSWLFRSNTVRNVAVWTLRRAPFLAGPVVRQVDRPFEAEFVRLWHCAQHGGLRVDVRVTKDESAYAPDSCGSTCHARSCGACRCHFDTSLTTMICAERIRSGNILIVPGSGLASLRISPCRLRTQSAILSIFPTSLALNTWGLSMIHCITAQVNSL